MAVSDYLEDDESGSTSGSSSMALVERAPWALNSQSYIGTGDTYGRLNTALNDPRSGTWTQPVSGSERNAEGLFGLLPPGTQTQIDKVAKKYHFASTGESLWKKAVAGSAASTEAGKPMTAFEWLSNYNARFGKDGADQTTGGNGPGGGGSAYTGPTTSVSYDPAAKPDVRALADAVAQDLMGRVVTDEELDRILKRVRKYENNNPSVRVTDSQPGMSVGRTTSPGASNAGRQQVIEKLLAKNPDFMPYQMDHNVYDAMLGVMKQGEEIANG